MIAPLPYQAAIRDYLKKHTPDVWNWFVRQRDDAKQAESLHFQLLTSTYRLGREDAAEKDLYARADDIRKQLEIDAPITFYQLQEPGAPNASMLSLPGEMHLVFHGAIRANLSTNELNALLAHEIGHYCLDTREQGDFRITREILSALSHDPFYGETYLASFRFFNLYTELFCDRIALDVSKNLENVVSMFVKIRTGLDNVSAKNYLQQADEIFSNPSSDGFQTEGDSHPEIFVRTRSLALWNQRENEGEDVEKINDSKIETEIAKIIQGEPKLDGADLLDRIRLEGLTRQLIDVFLAPKSLQTDLTLTHARLFFNDYLPPAKENEQQWDSTVFPVKDESLRDYWCFILLDFTTADRDLEALSLEQSFEIAKRLRLADRFAELAQKELKLHKRDVLKYSG